MGTRERKDQNRLDIAGSQRQNVFEILLLGDCEYIRPSRRCCGSARTGDDENERSGIEGYLNSILAHRINSLAGEERYLSL